MIQTMKTLRRVNFEDCDPFSHLNNVKYITYFISAREEQLRTHNILDIFEHVKSTGNGWAVTGHEIRYLRPALVGEEVEIWSRMLSFDRYRNLVEFVMIQPQTQQLKSIMLSEFAYFSVKTAQPVPLDEEDIGLFERVSLYPGQELSSFEISDRIKAVKTEMKSA